MTEPEINQIRVCPINNRFMEIIHIHLGLCQMRYLNATTERIWYCRLNDVKSWELVSTSIKFDNYGHGFPNCDCDLEGGDTDCEITPSYQTPAEQYKSKLITLLQLLYKEGIKVKDGELIYDRKANG